MDQDLKPIPESEMLREVFSIITIPNLHNLDSQKFKVFLFPPPLNRFLKTCPTKQLNFSIKLELPCCFTFVFTQLLYETIFSYLKEELSK